MLRINKMLKNATGTVKIKIKPSYDFGTKVKVNRKQFVNCCDYMKGVLICDHSTP